MLEKLSSNHVVKLGIVCEDVENTARCYHELFKTEAKPDSAIEEAPLDIKTIAPYKEYMGKACAGAPLKVATVFLQPIYLELVQPLDDTPSPWRRHLDKYGTSVCFAALYIDGFEKHIDLMESKGYPLLYKEEKGFERYAYFDTMAKLGLLLETKERTPRLPEE